MPGVSKRHIYAMPGVRSCQERQDRRKGEYDENGTVEIKIGPGCSVNRSVRLAHLAISGARTMRLLLLADVLQGGGGVNNTLHLPAPRLLAASVRLPAAFRCVMPVTISTAALSRDRASGTTSAWSSGGRLSPDRLPVHAHLAAVTRQHAPGTGVVSHRAAMTTSRRFGVGGRASVLHAPHPTVS